jgi:hypothetical protein
MSSRISFSFWRSFFNMVSKPIYDEINNQPTFVLFPHMASRFPLFFSSIFTYDFCSQTTRRNHLAISNSMELRIRTVGKPSK